MQALVDHDNSSCWSRMHLPPPAVHPSPLCLRSHTAALLHCYALALYCCPATLSRSGTLLACAVLAACHSGDILRHWLRAGMHRRSASSLLLPLSHPSSSCGALTGDTRST
jgi:hypothetical protein